ncbi:site-specific integrase [Haloterrigena sp. SYSU A121-1]|uniref:Site-specific integrase n=1 Tax=Haloterrigena gelatinilytica TaxID=2741724 RepID=A0A8J8GJG2_9EURY|nr:site-specific integrase [Haloterrigena gelatinilytica]NUB91133.1 site-specific integrase [Haloterrigena gelatinilytica]
MVEIRLNDYRDDYIERRKQKQSETTAEQKALTVRHLTDYLDDEQETIDTTEPYEALDAIRDFFDSGRITVSGTRLSHIRDFLEYIASHLDSTRAQDQLLDIRDKVEKDRWPKEAFESDETEPEFIRTDDIRRACQLASDRGVRAIRFLFETGCRLGEMRAVTVNDIDFDHPEVGAAVSITKKKTEKNTIEPPKTQAGYRTVELTPKTADLLQNHIKENNLAADDEVFPMSPNTYRNHVEAGFTKAGVCIDPESGETEMTPHWLRHNRNTRIKKEEGSEAAQQYMGHGSQDDKQDAATEMTDHYTHYDPDEVQCIVGTEDWF